jgi:hypothetical protein
MILTITTGAPQDFISLAENTIEQEDEISTECYTDIYRKDRAGSTRLATERGGAEAESDQLVSNEHTADGVLLVSNNGQLHSERSLALDQDSIEFEVEDLVAKGRIGRRIWYKVKWKGYPESDNSWVKKKDVGLGSIADYKARHPRNQGQFEFERLVSKQEIGGDLFFEAKWRGQAATENIWVGRRDLGAKVVVAFEAELKV